MKNVSWLEILIILAIALVLFALVASGDGKIKVIDGCQYIQSYNGHGYSITHKGNCTNTVHEKK